MLSTNFSVLGCDWGVCGEMRQTGPGCSDRYYLSRLFGGGKIIWKW